MVPETKIRKHQSENPHKLKTNRQLEQELKSARDIDANLTKKQIKPKQDLLKVKSETTSEESLSEIMELKIPEELKKQTETIKNYKDQKLAKHNSLHQFLRNWDESAFNNENGKEIRKVLQEKKKRGIRAVQSEDIISNKVEDKCSQKYREKMLHFSCLKKNISKIDKLRDAFKEYYLIDYSQTSSVKLFLK